MNILVYSLISLIGVSPFIANAQTTAADSGVVFEVTPFVGYRGGGEFDAADEGTPNMGSDESFGLLIGILTNADTSYEFLYSSQEANLKGPDDLDVRAEHLHLGGTAQFNQGARMAPFIAGGIGGTRLTPEVGEDELRLSASLGLGALATITDRFRARLELRGYLVSMDGNGEIFCSSTQLGSSCALKAAGSTLFQYELILGAGFVF